MSKDDTYLTSSGKIEVCKDITQELLDEFCNDEPKESLGEAYNLPTPTPLFKPIEKAMDYPVKAFGKYASLLEAIQDITQAPIALAGQSFLSIASLCVQDIADVETLSGSYSPTSLYAATLAVSGERKSSCDNQLKKRIEMIEESLERKRIREMKDYKVRFAIWKNKYDSAIRQHAKKGEEASYALEADIRAAGDPPDEPLECTITMSNVTIEGIFDILDTGRPSIGLFTDEGGNMLGGHVMNKDNRLKSVSAFSSFWDGKPTNQVRRTAKTKTLYGKRFAMHIMIQPDIARDLFSDGISAAQGFLPRMLITYPESTIGTRLKRGHKAESRIIVQDICDEIEQHLLRPLNIVEDTRNDLNIGKIRLTDEAKEALYEFYDETEIEQREGGKYYSIIGYASKAAENAARIAAVLTLFEDPNAKMIIESTMRDAIEIMHFYISEILRITGNMVVSPELLQAEKLRQWLCEKYAENEITIRIAQQLAWGNFKNAKEVKRAFEILREHGWLIPCNEPIMVDGHRAKEAWHINRG